MKKILVLGAGHSSPYLIARLLELAPERDWRVTVADVDPQQAARRVAGHDRGAAVAFDADSREDRRARIGEADVVINMLAPRFLEFVAADCVALGKSMFNVSYLDASVRELGARAEEKGVLLLCELGLDPGIDHMSAMALIERIRGDGGRIRAFRSYGSGIPAPESAREPLRYAITWNPRNVVMSSEAGAQYLKDGRVRIVPYPRVFSHTWPVEVPGVGTLEAYPNRDSLDYPRLFGLDDVRTMIRATLRYPGFCETWGHVVALGLPNEKLRIPDLATRSYREVLEMFLPEETSGTAEARVAQVLGLSADGPAMDKLRWLGLFDEQPTGCPGETSASMLIDLLQRKLPLRDDERDMVILQHELEVEWPDRAPERVVSTMVAKGEAGGFTAMSKSVGLPVAIATDLYLQGKIELSGARIPTHPSIYEPELPALAVEGLGFEERREPL